MPLLHTDRTAARRRINNHGLFAESEHSEQDLAQNSSHTRVPLVGSRTAVIRPQPNDEAARRELESQLLLGGLDADFAGQLADKLAQDGTVAMTGPTSQTEL